MLTNRLTAVRTLASQSRLFSSAAAVEHSQKQERKEVATYNRTEVTNSSGVARIQLVFKAGCRYENRNELGIGHFIRRAAELSNGQHVAFANTRDLGEIGCSLSVSSTREHLIYSLDHVQNQETMERAFRLMLPMVFQPLYHEFELETPRTAMQMDLSILAHRKDVHVIELLHQAAYQESLRQSLYAPRENIGIFDQQMALSFMNRRFKKINMVCVNTKKELMDQLEDVDNFFRSFNAEEALPTQKAVYCGGSLFQSIAGEANTYAAVAVEGASFGSKDALPLAVLQRVMCKDPRVKYTSYGGRVTKAVAKTTNSDFVCGSLNMNYSDSGLFGFSIAASADEAGTVLKAAASEMKSLCSKGASKEEVEAAKAILKMDTARQHEDISSFASIVTEHVENGLAAPTLKGALEAIDKVTVEQVNEAAKSLLKRKPTLAAEGNTMNVPDVENLFD